MDILFLKDREECEGYEVPQFFDAKSFRIWLINTLIVIILSVIFLVCAGVPQAHSANISHFKRSDFACKCCGKIVVNDHLIAKLEELRRELGDVKIYITNGYRCPRHNKEVRGAHSSYHMKGIAVDIKVEHYRPAEIAEVAKMVGFTGIGIYQTWTHIDLRGGDLVCWKY